MATTTKICWCGAVIALSVLIASVIGHRAVCGNTPPVWRNSNETCPEGAVCADVFETTRDWYNGTRCEETRVLHNCMCDGGTVCPYHDDDYRVFASKRHTRYTCRPACLIPWCEFSRSHPSQDAEYEEPSLTSVQNALEFGRRTYYRLDCRCPKHYIRDVNDYRVSRSVEAYSLEFNSTTRNTNTLYRCISLTYTERLNGRREDDPCLRA